MKKSIVILIILTTILVSCQKFDNAVDEDTSKTTEIIANGMSALNISDNFDWSMIKTLDVQITLPNEPNLKITKILSLDRTKMYFNGYPEDGSNVLKTKVSFPTYVENVLIEYGDGTAGKVVSIAGKSKSLTTVLTSSMLKDAWAAHVTPTQSIYQTPPTCGVTISGTNGNIDLDDGIVYCIETGTTVIAGNITFKGGTLYVKGKLIADKLKAQGNDGGYIYVAPTGEIESDQLSFNGFTEFINYGKVTDSNNGGPTVDADMLFENHGELNCNGIVNNSEDFLNSGIMNVDGQFNNNGNGVNEGTIIVTGPNGHFNNTGNPDITFYNYCKIYVEQHFNQNSKFYHYGYIEVEKQTTISGSGNTFMVMGQYSFIKTTDLQIAGEVQGPDESGAKFKVADDTKLTGAADISGYIQICDEEGTIEVNNGNLGAHVDFGCDLEIPENECNPGDNNQEPPDPETFTGTLAYEDLWPGKGDYDINDLVVEYNFNINKDNNEKIKDITATFKIRAFGAALHNGFGFSFPNVNPNSIISVTGYQIQSGSIYNLASNGTESAQSQATFIVLDDPFNIMQHPGSGIGVNTDHPAPYVEPVTITLFIDFVDNTVSYSQLNIGQFNPFLVVNQVRGMEIHLPDYTPTSLVNPAYWGTFEDDTNPSIGRFYKTTDNLFWAINIPETFDYPNEKQVILGAYNHFAAWAQSDGVAYPDWYKNLPGYRNSSAIY